MNQPIRRRARASTSMMTPPAAVGARHHPFWVSGSNTWKRVSPGAEVKRRSPWWR
jgi:hypothetical protein